MIDKPTIILGRYRHYKGREYDVVAVAKHTETSEPLVVYRCLYGDGSWWVRPLPVFIESVMIDGREVQRFQFVGGTDEPE